MLEEQYTTMADNTATNVDYHQKQPQQGAVAETDGNAPSSHSAEEEAYGDCNSGGGEEGIVDDDDDDEERCHEVVKTRQPSSSATFSANRPYRDLKCALNYRESTGQEAAPEEEIGKSEPVDEKTSERTIAPFSPHPPGVPMLPSMLNLAY